MYIYICICDIHVKEALAADALHLLQIGGRGLAAVEEIGPFVMLHLYVMIAYI